MFYYFHKYLDKDLKKIRGYFNSEFRGFGEDAFFSIWYFIFQFLKPKNVLEIGVYRGQCLVLFQTLSDKFNLDCIVSGVSPFSNIGDEYSEYLELDYIDDIHKSFKYFGLEYPNLEKGLSQDKNIVNYIQAKKWDLIYVDGSHDYDIVIKDLRLSVNHLIKGGILAIDDSNKNKDFNSKIIQSKFNILSTEGHEGPTLALDDLLQERNDIEKFISIGHINFLIKTK